MHQVLKLMEVCLIFDIGKTNKKAFVFDKEFKVLEQVLTNIEEIVDDDGENCEDLRSLEKWMLTTYENFKKKYTIKALNISAYGASFVYLNKDKKVSSPLYNYLKSFPRDLKKTFLEKYNRQNTFFTDSCSPDLGMLNAGLQLYWMKYQKTDIYKNINAALALPQYLSFLFSGLLQNEITSMGCHTGLWDFKNNCFQAWVKEEKLKIIDLPLVSSDTCHYNNEMNIGPGIHDSSAALVPYLKTIDEPFLLISTGSWSICLNPFDQSELTENELAADLLYFLRYDGPKVKASRIFSGNEHDRHVKHLSSHFGVEFDYFKKVKFDSQIIKGLRKRIFQAKPETVDLGELKESPFVERNLNQFHSFEEAYHQLMLDLVVQQAASIYLLTKNMPPPVLIVEGGFSKNDIFMHLLSEVFFHTKTYRSSLSQGSSLGAALVMGKHFTNYSIDKNTLGLELI